MLINCFYLVFSHDIFCHYCCITILIALSNRLYNRSHFYSRLVPFDPFLWYISKPSSRSVNWDVVKRGPKCKKKKKKKKDDEIKIIKRIYCLRCNLSEHVNASLSDK